MEGMSMVEEKDIRNIYCDESCHLQAQDAPLVLGAVMAPASRVHYHRDALRRIKERYGLKPFCEMKWTGISASKVEAYHALVDYFFDHDDLRLRVLVARGKDRLDHERFHQSYDDWYYKMYFSMLHPIISVKQRNRIYIDIKDTRSCAKVKKLHEILCSKELDFDHALIERVQEIRSHEVGLMSLVDVLIGAVAYHARGLATSEAKLSIVKRMQERSGLTLERSTLLGAQKVNVFYWSPQCP